MTAKYFLIFLIALHVVESNGNLGNEFITQTVYGFLDFTTTIGNTVMVFSPQSAPPEGEKAAKVDSVATIQTKPERKGSPDIQPSKTRKIDSPDTKKQQQKNTKIVISSVVEQNVANSVESESKVKIQASTQSPVVSSIVQTRTGEETPVKNNLAEPEYDFLSRQPTEVVDETYKLINLRPSSKPHPKPRPSTRRDKENPTGLVTKLGGTIVKDGLTTVHETSVIGTYINGKYAQVLQSASRVLPPEGRIKPSSTSRILKTIGPQQGKPKPHLDPTPTAQDEASLPLEVLFSGPGSGSRTTRRHSASTARPKFRNKNIEDYESNEAQARNHNKNRGTTARPSYKNRALTTTTTVEPTTRRRGFRPNQQSSTKQPKPKLEQQPSTNPVPKVKLPRTQGRWSYKTTPKPRVPIRKPIEEEEPKSTTEMTSEPEQKTTTSSLTTKKIQESTIHDEELDPSETEDVPNISAQEQNQEILPVETINVEISTQADLDDVYFEIATIKSPYAFQVGTLRNTRYVTVTSTIKKSFSTPEPTPTISPTEPLTENILANTGAAYETSLPLDSSIATLPAISLESGQATPPLETLTETFSTTQTLLKTHLLPVIHGSNTTRLTLVQTYNIARLVTATKTLPPMEIYQFIPSKTLNEFNSKLDEAGSELHLDLDYGDEDRDDEDLPKRIVAPKEESEGDLEVIKPSSASKLKDSSNTPTSEAPLSPEQAQLAFLKYFGQQQVITTSRPVVVLETLYESHVIPVVNGGNTIYSTLSRPVGTVPKTSYEIATSTVAPILPPQVPQVPQVPQLPLFPQQPQFTITSAPIVTQTLATVSESRVLKLTFGAKTAYTTLYSTKVVPTELTTYVTTTVPLQPTIAPFPGYYPSPVGYPPFPFVG